MNFLFFVGWCVLLVCSGVLFIIAPILLYHGISRSYVYKAYEAYRESGADMYLTEIPTTGQRVLYVILGSAFLTVACVFVKIACSFM